MSNDTKEDPRSTQIALVRLRWALHRIIHLESCLLADAQEIAKEALRETE